MTQLVESFGEKFKLHLHPGEEILSDIIREKGFYSRNDLWVFRSLLSPSAAMIDVGANLGWHSVAMAKYLCKGFVYAVEPDPTNLSLLNRNILENELGNVGVIPMALSNYTGKGRLSLSGANFGDHILDPQLLLDVRDVVEVDVNTGDALLAEPLLETGLELIKIDAQGSECKILDGFKSIIQKHQPAVMIEYSPRHIRAAGDSVFEIFAFIEKNGYFPFQIVEDLEREPHRLLDFVSIEGLLKATGILLERGTGVDLLLVKPAHIERLQQQGFVL
ncbi:FkbM family methyltransferase [Bdellovibrio bacteriovorus]|uniref:FkbM family methyltransferase n=1 Tax=Bdellovibrio bacteriovorus TaxID=959 RepID=UPI0035A6C71A